jgi:hypothetical protein
MRLIVKPPFMDHHWVSNIEPLLLSADKRTVNGMASFNSSSDEEV